MFYNFFRQAEIKLFFKAFSLIFCLFFINNSSSLAQKQATSFVSDSLFVQLQKYESDTIGMVYIEGVELHGNRITKDKIIYRELDFQKGSFLPKKNIISYFENEKNKVLNTNLFETVDIVIKEKQKDVLVVIINLEERWYTWPIPIFELADRNLNEWINNRGADFDRIRYGIAFKRRNFRGRKESLDFTVRLGFLKHFVLNYHIPFLDKAQKTSLNIGAVYEENKTVAYQTVDNKFVEINSESEVMGEKWWFFTRVGKRVGFYEYHNITLAYSYKHVHDSVLTYNPNYFVDGKNGIRYFSLQYDYTKDLRDIRNYPLKGSLLRLEVMKKGIGIFDDINSVSLEGTYVRYTPIGKSHFYHEMGGVLRLSYPDIQPYQDLRQFGYGSKILRGYDNYVIDSQHLGIVKNTLRFKALSSKINLGKVIPIKYLRSIPIDIYFKGYADAGYSYIDNMARGDAFMQDRLSNNMLLGWGAGIDLVTSYNTVMRFEYSYNRHDLEGGFYLYFKSSF